jgi:hypothetical protein
MSRSDKHASSGRQNDAPAGALSRRDLLPTLVGSVAIVGAALSLGDSRMAAAQSKTSQQTAKYQDHPNNGSSCATCNFFRPPQSCQLVAGTISANGWCSFYAKKS